MGALIVIVPGLPRGKGRPRFVSTSRGGRTYTDAQTASYENLVKMCAKAAGAAVSDGPHRVEIVAYFEPAASWSKKRIAAALANEIAPAKIDLDNCAKAILDGLNGVAWRDDKSVCELVVSKRFAAEARVEIRVCPPTGINQQSDGSQRTKAA